ncbi:short chain enoyl-CoA hydratase [Austwickia chelonae]|uniref:enoyl-CoA hydratase n=1 Tax=Austwickia chelonae NBRC 105200 TaxID=1184607 RepID=K6V3S7_9MICO|nr:enoyl-CoA hydratase-related protein [Austwickia chelonae]GAB76763.1 putative enoyl-CoA hydratase [Austwickia chelonae NBRC 105200]SEW30342.1 short chain enoyl-CoA hydratase [Austwickia chelonae]
MTEHDQLVTVRHHGPQHRVAELVLNRPDAMNAVSTAMARAIAQAAAELTQDRSISCVVLTSSHPRAFCVGADLKERQTFSDADLFAQRPTTRAAYTGILDLPIPAVAAVDGFALGGGYELALACDLIVAGAEATLGLPEVSVGVIPGGGGTQLLTRRVGWSKAARLIFTAHRMTAAEAAGYGLVDLLAPAGQAREQALELADRIAAHSPVGLRQAKRAMRLGADVDLRSGLEIEDACWRATAFSADRAEGVAAFVEKREPRWPGY